MLILGIYSLIIAIAGLLGSLLSKEPKIRLLAFVVQVPVIIFFTLFIFNYFK